MAEMPTEITVEAHVDAHCALHVEITLWEALKLRLAGAGAVKEFLEERLHLTMESPGAAESSVESRESDVSLTVTATQEEAIGQAAWRWIARKAALRQIPLRLERE